ncbi:exosome non-catalytic core subunit rrp40 [Ascosphaera pollenicola]|nr:exosome non-catalytic core subunit rrp40 [Ascosphaera pollenicola]
MAKATVLDGLSFERKNKDLLRIPKNARISKRPIPHPPPSNPYAGSSAPKIVYVSTKSPFMSAVKRVQKLLSHAEARATAKIELTKKRVGEKQRMRQLMDASDSLSREPVYVKATGRAIEKVVNMGKWFEERSEYTINTTTGSVLVVDDIVEDEKAVEDSAASSDKALKKSSKKKARKLAVDEDGELLESRTRYINTIELAVTMK